jgi:hypothetical protein
MTNLIETKVYLPRDLAREIDRRAAANRLSKSEVIRAAIAIAFSPDAADQMEAALGRRLDRMSRQIERLERDVTIGVEILGVFTRAWFTATPPVPEAGRAAAEALGKARQERMIEEVARRYAAGRSITKEVLEDKPGDAGS